MRFSASAFVDKSHEHLSQIGKKVAESESGKQYELKREQERRKREPRAAEKRPKSNERYLGDARQQHRSVPGFLQERLGEAKWNPKGVPEASGRR